MFKLQYPILSAIVDNPYKHVHHADVVRILEAGREAFLAYIGFPLEALLQQQLLLVVTRVDVRYLREVLSGTVTVTCEDPELSKKEVIVKQRIINQKGKTAVEASIHSAFVSAALKRAVPPPDAFLDASCRCLLGGIDIVR